LRHLLGLHHQNAALGEALLLAGLRRELIQLFHGVTKKIGFFSGFFDPVAVILKSLPGIAHPAGGLAHGLDLGGEAPEGIEDSPVRHGIHKGTVVMLAMDLDQGRANGFQHLDADRLIVDEGARAAVRHLHPAQDQIAVDIDVGIRGDPACRMIHGAIEDSRHLSLRFTMPNEASIASSAKSQCKGIKQNGLAGSGLSCKDAQALEEMKLKLVDKDDVANRQLDQHGK
jgi:hypothetical protein